MAIDLAVQKREKLGKSVNSLRREGLVPAELYGRGIENLHLSVPAKDFLRIFKEAGTNTVINLMIGSEKRSVIIYEVGKNYLTSEVDHVDFYQVRMDEAIKAKIPVEFLGISPAVKDKGGILNKSISEIEVEALPADLPHNFKVDLAVLAELNQSIYVKDINIPHKVKVLIDPETPIVTVTEPRVEEVVAPAPTVDVSEVKVETEEKKAERVAEKATEKVEEKPGK
ncbi:MAG: 50S ribosomal protein L25 [Patescibacteria group bacterium]